MSSELVPIQDEIELRMGFRQILRMNGRLGLLRCIAEMLTSARIGMEVLSESDK